MASLKDIRKRITSVKKTQKTTSAMKMVSAAKLRRAQDAIERAMPYADYLRQVVRSLSGNCKPEDHPFFVQSEGKRVAVILVTSDRGLCGGFNTSLCKAVMRELQEQQITNAEITVIGRKGRDFFKRSPHTLAQIHTEIHPSQQLALVRQVMSGYAERIEKRELDRVYLAYSHFVTALTQTPRVEVLLPVQPAEEASGESLEMIFEPTKEEILDALLRKYLENRMLVAWLDSTAGEHAARMTSMDSATKNAGDMIEKLQLYYNRTRQAAITKELIEIISGAQSV